MLNAFMRKDTVMPINLKTIASTDWPLPIFKWNKHFFPEQTETTAMQIKATSSSHLQEIPKTRSDHKTWKTVGHPFSWLLSNRWVSTLENDAKHRQREDERIRYLLPEHPKTYCYLNCSRTNARWTQMHLLCRSLPSLTKKTVPVLTSFSRTWTYFNFLGSVILGRVTF